MYAAQELGVRLDVPYNKLSRKEKDFVLHGAAGQAAGGPVRAQPAEVRLNVTYDNATVAAEKSQREQVPVHLPHVLRLPRHPAAPGGADAHGSTDATWPRSARSTSTTW